MATTKKLNEKTSASVASKASKILSDKKSTPAQKSKVDPSVKTVFA